RTAAACDIDATEPWVELDDVRALRHRQLRDHLVRLEIEHGQNVIAFARQERAPSLRVDGHPVVALTAGDRVAADDGIRARIDDREDVLILEIDVDLPCDLIVLRHTGLAVETQHREGAILSRVDHGYRLRALIRDVRLVEGSRVGDTVRLGLGGDLLHDLHLAEIDDADLVLVPVRRIDLTAFADVGDALDSGYIADRRHDGVVPEIDHMEQPR